jgi:hypothetical protein
VLCGVVTVTLKISVHCGTGNLYSRVSKWAWSHNIVTVTVTVTITEDSLSAHNFKIPDHHDRNVGRGANLNGDVILTPDNRVAFTHTYSVGQNITIDQSHNYDSVWAGYTSNSNAG